MIATRTPLAELEPAGLVQVVDSGDGRLRVYRLDAARLGDVAGTWIERFDHPQ